MSANTHFDLIVIGAGAMGLASAYEASKSGLSVLVLEAGDVPGGMAAHFDFDGLSLERYYHFICKTDYDSFALFKELGIFDRLQWRATKMGYYYHGQSYKWGNPLALLSFPHLTLIEKFRYALMAFWATKRKNWDAVEPLTAPQWLQNTLGKSGYDKLWARLFELKFYEHTKDISATWIGTRIRRIGLSRRSLMQEELGYLEGGTETLVSALVKAVEATGGMVKTSAPVTLVERQNASLHVKTPLGKFTADHVISTVPTPLISRMIPSLPKGVKEQYDAIPNIGVACLIFKLKKSVTENFWLNIIDDNHAVPGLIEFSNLRPVEDAHIVYVPYYMPVTNPRWAWSDAALLDEAFAAITAANPDMTKDDILATQVSRLKHAQPICYPNFKDMLPPVQTEIEGLQIADTCYYYPEDRGISESIGFGRMMAKSVINKKS
ncbi:NAD(P)/FAD-dependent oxidoreductase [Fretibacter rubidus]|uniref:NAD(P)/FAD-dependent oxidoreductase n=1 Tax=Fretibacter rubidus TaxID=570162 RepID=UPI00352AA773